MEIESIQIIPARQEDAPYIAEAILRAIGEDLTLQLAGPDHGKEDVLSLFTNLAGRPDTQYSYLNSIIAMDHKGSVVGVCICYDGVDLHKLRPPFFEEAKRIIGLEIEGEPADETDENECYLDTLAVFPGYEGKGIGHKLIDEASSKAKSIGKPLGLLCSSHNPKARHLYERMGFVYKGQRSFAGELMDHYQLMR